MTAPEEPIEAVLERVEADFAATAGPVRSDGTGLYTNVLVGRKDLRRLLTTITALKERCEKVGGAAINEIAAERRQITVEGLIEEARNQAALYERLCNRRAAKSFTRVADALSAQKARAEAVEAQVTVLIAQVHSATNAAQYEWSGRAQAVERNAQVAIEGLKKIIALDGHATSTIGPLHAAGISAGVEVCRDIARAALTQITGMEKVGG